MKTLFNSRSSLSIVSTVINLALRVVSIGFGVCLCAAQEIGLGMAFGVGRGVGRGVANETGLGIAQTISILDSIFNSRGPSAFSTGSIGVSSTVSVKLLELSMFFSTFCLLVVKI